MQDYDSDDRKIGTLFDNDKELEQKLQRLQKIKKQLKEVDKSNQPTGNKTKSMSKSLSRSSYHTQHTQNRNFRQNFVASNSVANMQQRNQINKENQAKPMASLGKSDRTAFNSKPIGNKQRPARKKQNKVISSNGLKSKIHAMNNTIKSGQMANVLKKSLTFRIMLYTFLFISIAAVIMIFYNISKDTMVFGYYLYTADSSMSATAETKEAGLTGGFGDSSLVGIQPSDADEIQAGDIIAIYTTGDQQTTLISRVVDIYDEVNGHQGLFFATKQDNSNIQNPLIPAEYVIGKKVFAIPLLGGFVKAIKNSIAALFLLLILCMAFILLCQYYIRHFIPIKKGKKRGIQQKKRKTIN